jgi:hypothetical protein
MNVEEYQKKIEELNTFVKTWPCLDCKYREHKNGFTILTGYVCLKDGNEYPFCVSCPHKEVSPDIRYYMGKYKVRLLPKIAPKYKPHSRVFETLEEFSCDAVEMMMEPGEQYMTSTRYLYLKPIIVKEKSEVK